MMFADDRQVGYEKVKELAARSVKGPEAEAAWNSLLELAKQGNVEAQFRVSAIYGVLKQNASEQDKWERRAAENGHQIAQRNIAVDYLNMQKNEEALLWIRRWAKEKKMWAELYLAQLYSEGRAGLHKDYAEAMRWYKKVLYEHSALPSIDTADVYAEIGELYRTGGYGINEDLVKAYSCYRVAMILNTNPKRKLVSDPKSHVKSLKKKITMVDLDLADRMIKEEVKGKHKLIPDE